MKKYSIFLLSALALGFSACDDKSDLGIPQVNEQEPIAEANGLTLTASSAYNATIDLENTVGQTIDIASVAGAEGFPEGTTFTMKLAVAKSEDMSGKQIVAVNNGKISSDDLEDVIVDFYKITPEVVNPWMGVEVYANVGTQQSRLGGDNFYYLKKQVNVLPVDAKLDIESAYFLGGTESQKMDHSDQHAYVDNNFISIFEVSSAQAQAGFEWMIVPQSQESAPDPAKCWGPQGDKLVLGAKGTITAPGRYRLVADMLKKTFTLTFAYEVLYTPGSGNGWNQANSLQLYTDNYADYFGVTRTGADGEAKGEFKLDASTDWSMNWGLNGGVLTPNGDNIVTEPAGLYFVKVNLNALSISLLLVQSVGIIGLNGNWDNDIVMTSSSDGLVWTGTIKADGDTDFKFRFNGGWDANLGGSMDKLVSDGANIPVSAGTYEVVLDMTKVPYTCTLTSK